VSKAGFSRCLSHRVRRRMMRTVMRVSVQASISAVQMSANSIKYVTSVFMWIDGSRLAI
jgi:hypothetical protein